MKEENGPGARREAVRRVPCDSGEGRPSSSSGSASECSERAAFFARHFCESDAPKPHPSAKKVVLQIHPAVDIEHLAGDVRGILVGEETDSGGDVLYLGEAAKRDLGDDLLLNVVRNGF